MRRISDVSTILLKKPIEYSSVHTNPTRGVSATPADYVSSEMKL